MVFLSFPFRPGTGKEKNSTKRNSKSPFLRERLQQHHLSAEPLPGAEHPRQQSPRPAGGRGSYVLKSLIIAQDER